MAEQNEMDKVLYPMMEYACDKLCRWPHEVTSEKRLDNICAGCKMDQYICDILSTHNAARRLQVAAETVRNELTEKGGWYRALVNSIYGYLRDTDGSEPWGQMASDLADRIVGAEPVELDGDKNTEERTCKTCGNRCNSLCDECKFYDGVECHQQADECRECTRGQNWIPEI